MPVGRKPVPTALKVIHGNPGERRLVPDPAPPGVPSCPAHLKGEARKEWRRLTRLLPRMGVMSEVDRAALALLCVAWGDHVHARQMMLAEAAKNPEFDGRFVTSPIGFVVQSPWLAVSNRSFELYLRVCTEFGLTPSSRARANMGPSLPAKAESVPKKSGWQQFG